MKTKNWTLIIVATCLLFVALNSFANPPLKSKKISYRSTGNLLMAELSGNLEYDFARSAIRPVYYSKLNKLADYLITNKTALALRGYADSIGNFKSNWKLSEKRAVIVKKYLVKKGVPTEKVVTTAFGSTEPLTSNKTAQGRQKNRRVEIKINEPNQ